MELLNEFIREKGSELVLTYMGFVQDNAEDAVLAMFEEFKKGGKLPVE